MERSDLLSRITIDPEICNGRPTIRGKRITAQTVLEFLSVGESREEILGRLEAGAPSRKRRPSGCTLLAHYTSATSP